MDRRLVVAAGVVGAFIVFGLVLYRPSPSEDTSLAGRVATMVPQVEEAIGLKFKTPPVVESRSREEVREFLIAQLEDSTVAADLAGQEQALRLFGLLREDVSLRALLLDVLEEQVAGFYDPATKVLYVVDGDDPMIRDITISHELIHALQDQYVPLDSIQHIRGDDDRQLAAQAVMEGQATFEQLRMMGGGDMSAMMPGGWEAVRQMIRQEQSRMPRFAAAPLVVQELLLFPYLSGAEFTRRYREMRGDSLMLQNLPTSTEQILHSEAFFGTLDAPTRVTLPPLQSGTSLYENGVGEFGVRLFLFQHLSSQDDALRGAMGWDGDRFRTFQTSQGPGLVWVTLWDSPLDGAEFGDLVVRHIRRRYRPPGVDEIPAAQRPGTVTGTLYTVGGRQFFVAAAEIEGRPAVVYVDVPEGANWRVMDWRRIGIE